MQTNLYAHTESSEAGREYPGFVSLNQGPGGVVNLTVRSRGNGGMLLGVVALPPDVRAALGAALIESAKAEGQ